VLVSRFSDGEVQCTSGVGSARIQVHYQAANTRVQCNASEVQCTSGAEDAGVKKCTKSSLNNCL
jgi:hypothetical protein